jgi:hypothetical protein
VPGTVTARVGALALALGVSAGLLSGCSETRTASGSENRISALDEPVTATPASTVMPTGAIFLPQRQWRPSNSGGTRAMSPCLRRPLQSLEAEATRLRAFASVRDDTSVAHELLVVFPDRNAAHQGMVIVKDWQFGCPPRLGDRHEWTRSALVDVEDAGDEAAWFDLVRDGTVRYSTGVIRVGTTLGVLTVEKRVRPLSESRRTMRNMLQRAGRRL